ncbi:hypothetical protein QZH41_007277 [Actinostola sp. cb2023]|nr:hypothetical protein QZH41_007277 [Actinostola sp. cb2023]
MSLDERHDATCKKGICGNCLVSGHAVSSCPKPSFCKVEGCKAKHSTYLHPKVVNSDEKKPTDNKTNGDATARNGYVKASIPSKSPSRVSRDVTGLAIVPVKVKAKGSDEVTETYAFLDGGSNTTFLTDNLKERLNLKGKQTTLSLTTMEKEDSKTESSIVSLEVLDLDGNNLIELPMAFSISKLPVTTESMARQLDVTAWPHLRDINLPRWIESEVDLLIGSDVPLALQAKEVRGGGKGEPYATRTVLGWVINGPLGRATQSSRSSNFIHTDAELERQFRIYCNMEFNDSQYDGKTTMSQDDKQALSIMEETVQLKDGHYEMALPWKHSPPHLSNNKVVAEHRLKLLKRRLSRDPALSKMYSEFLVNLLNKGYARKVHKEVLDHSNDMISWYLPHHPVFHPQKPGKVRVVFDCSARYKGTSLNDQLLQGPDLTNSLTGVLTRFRQEPVALMSDIEAMFHQVHVLPKDCDALKFLWWPDGDIDRSPEEYQMMVHLFGGASSPSCANFALQKTAADFDTTTVKTIQRNFYVDDCLKSVKSDEEAIRLADQLRSILARGGFRLTKWISNSKRVIESIPESERAAAVKNVDFDDSLTERALGVRWQVESDKFGFKITAKDKPPTRRGILSIVSSVYDPLGFVARFIFTAKTILQDLCRKKLGWDDVVPDEDLERWNKWVQDLPKLEQFTVDRCLKPRDHGDVLSSQLHHFSDASLKGYGAVSYIRTVNTQGDIHCSFVTAKSRLTPLKLVTIPRLELSAAVVSTRLDRMIRHEIDLRIDESIFWTDSTCVLRYVENRDKRFQTFVGNRVSAICEQSSPSQWRYVDTKSNPADDASRGLSADEMLQTQRWINGPEFLWQNEENWPKRLAVMDATDDDLEIKKEAATFVTKIMAWVLRYKERLLQTCNRRKKGETLFTEAEGRINPISVEETKLAEMEILKYVQHQYFHEELSTLREPKNANAEPSNQARIKNAVKKASSIVKLDPILVDGLIRVGGRLQQAPIDAETMHPVILPKHHHIVELIVRHHHVTTGHSGLDCRRRQAPLGQQKMASLPKDRVTPSKPPFTYVGVDCFGPISVRRGRSVVKRYGVLFTCLTIRAVHIEIAHSLDTDSFIHSVRRFIARREQTVDDEGLLTLMCEVESIINGRPITKVSDDPKDLEALTPNHLLLLKSGITLPPGIFRKEDQYSRRRWRQVQYLADVFWRRSWPLGRILDVHCNRRDGLKYATINKWWTSGLDDQWIGPYIVENHDASNGTCNIKKQNGDPVLKRKVNIKDLKLFIQQPQTSSTQPNTVPTAQAKPVPTAQAKPVPTAQPNTVPTAQPNTVPTQAMPVPPTQAMPVPPTQAMPVPLTQAHSPPSSPITDYDDDAISDDTGGDVTSLTKIKMFNIQIHGMNEEALQKQMSLVLPELRQIQEGTLESWLFELYSTGSCQSAQGITDETKDQIACLLRCTISDAIKIEVQPIQQQQNSVDCGIFALAFATALCYGKDPCQLHFTRRAMRMHLWECMRERNGRQTPRMHRILENDNIGSGFPQPRYGLQNQFHKIPITEDTTGCKASKSNHSFGKPSKDCTNDCSGDESVPELPAASINSTASPASLETILEAIHGPRFEVQEVKSDNVNLRAMFNASNDAIPTSDSIPPVAVTLPELRGMADLVDKAVKRVASFGLDEDSDGSGAGGDDDITSVQQQPLRSRTSKPGKLKSGKEAKPTSKVLYPQFWPHSFLCLTHARREVKYEDLSMAEFVAGYVQILQSNDISSVERATRPKHLVSLMYRRFY